MASGGDKDSGAPSTRSEKNYIGFVLGNIDLFPEHRRRVSTGERVFISEDKDEINTIKVCNSEATKLGILEQILYRDVKRRKAVYRLLTSTLVDIEVFVANVCKAALNIPCRIHFFAKIEDLARVKSLVQASGFTLLWYYDRVFGTSELMAKEGMKKIKLDEKVKLMEENARKVVLGQMKIPEGLTVHELYQHQREGVHWLVQRENSEDLPPFWEEGEKGFVNVVTNYHTDQRPKPLRGGIFADESGLGKTLTLLCLIALNKYDGGSNELDHELVPSLEKSRRISFEKEPRLEELTGEINSKTTLIVCRGSILSTWRTQIEEHLKPGCLDVYVYSGKQTVTVKNLLDFDIVLTTYDTLAKDIMNWNAIKRIHWWRIILDDVHTIKNHETDKSIAVTMLSTNRRWVVTGAPTQSDFIDHYTVMVFLRLQPFSTIAYWNLCVQNLVSRGDVKGFSMLRALMAATSLRRTKGKALIESLPQKTMDECVVDLDGKERELYEELEERAKKLVEGEKTKNNYCTILQVFQWLRMLCTHSGLCDEELIALLSPYNFEGECDPEVLKSWIKKLQEDGEDYDCPICLCPPATMVITSCSHIFCQKCIKGVLKSAGKVVKCPMCRDRLSESGIFTAPPEVEKLLPSSSSNKVSSKVDALLRCLKESKSKDIKPSPKSVVFSQFPKLLTMLDEPLRNAGFNPLCLKKKMTAMIREDMIKKFEADESAVLLASPKCVCIEGGVNLTAASTVYFLDPWWNASLEGKAIDCVYRMGQKKNVRVVKMIARETIDERILDLQKEKEKPSEEEDFQIKNKREQDGGIGLYLDDLRKLVSIRMR